MGKLIVIDGTDGTGKATQSKLLYEKLLSEGEKVKLISFPDYSSRSSSLVKMYLEGEFGDDPEDVNPYSSSSFYAVDRVASYLSNWKKDYEQGYTIIADRYTQSNMVHQAAKLEGKEKEDYLSWLINYEFNLLKLPFPDKVIFLKVDPAVSEKLREKREDKIDGDIHEKDSFFMRKSYETAMEMAKRYDWNIIDCDNGEDIKDREVILEMILKKISPNT